MNNTNVAVLSSTGKRLMPTTNYRARKLLDARRAVIVRYRPVFTIQMTERSGGEAQPVELCVDTGYKNVGISVKSEKHEYLHQEYQLLPDETERHNDRRKYRRTRRNRKRYRKPRFDNRKGEISRDGFAPSIRNKRDRHVDLVRAICEVIPVTYAYVEMGNFDTQVLKAIGEGRPLPEGEDYQRGERYGSATLREAVFTRDGHRCIICGRGIKDGAILHEHHVGYWKGDRTDRMANLATVCEICHTSSNHKEGGALYGIEPKFRTLKAATFMTMVRWDMLKRMKASAPGVAFHATYGAATRLARTDLRLKKTHANDAYAMGKIHPAHKAHGETFRKQRRNDRILQKFYDAVYIDTRTGEKVKAASLGCNRTNRRESRRSEKNFRPFRGQKISKGRNTVRRSRTPLKPGSVVLYNGEYRTVKGIHRNRGSVNVEFKNPPVGKAKSASLSKVTVVSTSYTTGWVRIS